MTEIASKVIVFGAAVALVFFTRWRYKNLKRRKQKKKRNGSVNIGGKFSNITILLLQKLFVFY